MGGQISFLRTPHLMQSDRRGSQTGFIEESRLPQLPVSLSPHPQNPTWLGLVLYLPLRVCCPSHMDIQRLGGGVRACRQTGPRFPPVEQTSFPLNRGPCGSLLEGQEGQEGPRCAVTDEPDATAFPFQRGFSQAASCLRDRTGGHRS